MDSAIQSIGSSGEFALDVLSEDASGMGVHTAHGMAVVEGCDAVWLIAVRPVHVDAHGDVRTDVVGELCALGFARMVTDGRTGQQRLGAKGGEATFHANGDGMADVGIDCAARVDDDHLVGDTGLQIIEMNVLAKFGSVATDYRADQSVEGTEGLRSAGAVGYDTYPGLELTKCVVGVRPEDSVRPAGVEPELYETSLKLGDVIADHHVTGNVGQHPITELPASLV